MPILDQYANYIIGQHKLFSLILRTGSRITSLQELLVCQWPKGIEISSFYNFIIYYIVQSVLV